MFNACTVNKLSNHHVTSGLSPSVENIPIKLYFFDQPIAFCLPASETASVSIATKYSVRCKDITSASSTSNIL